jgi:hypothetical protein
MADLVPLLSLLLKRRSFDSRSASEQRGGFESYGKNLSGE